MSNPQYEIYLRRYLDNSISPEELKQLIGFMREEGDQHPLLDAVEHALTRHPLQDSCDKVRTDILFENILQKASQAERDAIAGESMGAGGQDAAGAKVIYIGRSKRILFSVAAAVILLMVIPGIYFGSLHKRSTAKLIRNKPLSEPSYPQVRPGHNGATLTLGDGTTIDLDDSAKGTLASQGNTKVLKLNNGQLSYHSNGAKGLSGEVVYNTVTTQRGEQYQIELADGSKVWLNAASSLRFPTSFDGKERGVLLKGEAYFEIAGNKEMPFKVQVGETKVEVLGTSFNVMAYEDEKMMRTTLVQGAVKVIGINANVLLRPGQQAMVGKGTAGIQIDEADIEEATAWKNGYFQFNSACIESVMRQIGRWYNMEAGYEGKMPDWHFSGSISRNTELFKVLKILEMNDIHFKVEGKKIIVLP